MSCLDKKTTTNILNTHPPPRTVICIPVKSSSERTAVDISLNQKNVISLVPLTVTPACPPPPHQSRLTIIIKKLFRKKKGCSDIASSVEGRLYTLNKIFAFLYFQRPSDRENRSDSESESVKRTSDDIEI